MIQIIYPCHESIPKDRILDESGLKHTEPAKYQYRISLVSSNGKLSRRIYGLKESDYYMDISATETESFYELDDLIFYLPSFILSNKTSNSFRFLFEMRRTNSLWNIVVAKIYSARSRSFKVVVGDEAEVPDDLFRGTKNIVNTYFNKTSNAYQTWEYEEEAEDYVWKTSLIKGIARIVSE